MKNVIKSNNVIVGIMQRSLHLHQQTVKSLDNIECIKIIIDSSPVPVVAPFVNTIIVHEPDIEGFFPIALLIPLFRKFLQTDAEKLFLIEGDMVLTPDNIKYAEHCTENTKAFYVESDPSSPHAYVRREGLAGIILRNEIDRIYSWMSKQPVSRFRSYEGYCDTFLWFAVSSEASGYSVSTSGPEWIPVIHVTHDDSTRVTKAQRKNMKVYRARLAEIINLSLECNKWQHANRKEGTAII